MILFHSSIIFQIKFFLAYLRKKFLVTKEDMMKDILIYENWSKTLGQSIDHNLEKNYREYMDDLAITANVKGIPPVVTKMYHFALHDNFQSFNSVYRVVNDEEFIWNEGPC